MALLFARILIPLLFVAAEAEIPLEERYPGAIEIFQCNFDPSCDANFDAWPDAWTRRNGQGYPSYLKIQIQPSSAPADHATHGVRQCLRVDLDGGAAAIFSPPIQVDAIYSYVLEGLLRAEGLKHDRAYFSLIFLDADKHPLVTFESEEVVDARDWKKISLGPIAPPSRETKLAVIGLYVEPRDAEDLKGSVAFTGIRLMRLPRLEVKTNQPHNLFIDTAKVEVTCTASGFAVKNPDINFMLLDAFGRCLAKETRKSEEKTADSSGDTQNDAAETTAGKARTVAWEPPIAGPGFYRVRAELQERGTAVQYRELTLAVLESRHAPAGGEFGWSLPQGAHPIPIAQLNPLLSQAGVNWIKYPLWFTGKNGDSILNQLLTFGEQLDSEGIELVGLLIDPPEDLREQLGPAKSLSAADIFAADPKIWYPSVEPVLSRLAGLVRWWQLGGDNDASFLTTANYADKISEIKKEIDRAARDVNLGIGWDCQDTLPSAGADTKLPLRFLALWSEPPLSEKELAAYLDACKDSPQKRWVALKPLPKLSNSVAVRTDDLVKRMIAAKIHGADAVFCPDPFDADCGLMNTDGTPGELFLPWRTTALELGGARFIGNMQLPHGTQNLLFARADDAVMIVWNDRPVEEVLYLGEDVKQIDLWGRTVTPEKRENARVIHADALPAFVTGLSEPIARWYADLSLTQERIPSNFGQSQANGFNVKNSFPCEAAGTATIVAPRGWIVQPKQFAFHLAAGEELREPFSLSLPDTAGSGRHKIRIDFEIQADRPYKFSAIRHIEVGLGDVYVEPVARLSPNGELEVEQRFVNKTDRPVNFRCELFAPQRRRLMVDVLDQGPGQKVYVYRLEDGKELIGKTLWLRATEIDGPRILNYRFTVKEGTEE